MPLCVPRFPGRTLGERIRRLRLEHGLYQAERAKRFGADEMAIVNWEKDRSAPRGKQLARPAETLGVESVPLLYFWMRIARPPLWSSNAISRLFASPRHLENLGRCLFTRRQKQLDRKEGGVKNCILLEYRHERIPDPIRIC